MFGSLISSAQQELMLLSEEGGSLISKIEASFSGERVSDVFTTQLVSWRLRCSYCLEKIDIAFSKSFNEYGPGAIFADLTPLVRGPDFITHQTTHIDRRRSAISSAKSNISAQIGVIDAAEKAVSSVFLNLQKSIAFGIRNQELDEACRFIEDGNPRPAGAIMGVVVETHLKSILENTGEIFDRDKMTLKPLLDRLKALKKIDNPNYARGELVFRVRNICVHRGTDDPKIEDVKDAIEAAAKLIRDTI